MQGLRSGNLGAVYASLMDFESLLARAAGPQQQALELAFLQNICAEL